MQLATLVDRQEFCLGNYGLKEHRSNAWQDFTCHVSVAPLWEIRIEGTCDSSLLEQRLWRFISKQDRQAVASLSVSLTMIFLVQVQALYIVLPLKADTWTFSRRKAQSYHYHSNRTHAAHSTLCFASTISTFEKWLSWLNIRCSQDLLRAWISRTIDRSQHLGLIFSASPRLVMFGCHNLKRSQPLEAFWPRLWPPQRKRQLLGESL